MRPAITTLTVERDRLAASLARAREVGKPKKWRQSEWAMMLASKQKQLDECQQALDVLSKKASS